MRYWFSGVVFAACVCLASCVSGDVVQNVKRTEIIRNKLRLVTIEHVPYMNISQGTNGLVYLGFLNDLMYILSQKLRFNYEFYQSPDGRWGALKEDGSWTGMMGELTERKYPTDNQTALPDEKSPGADVAVAPITLTSARTQAVDFLYPFHHLGLTVAVRKHYLDQDVENKFPFDFSILTPMTPAVWGLIIIALFVMGILLALMNHFNPYEWGGRFNLGLASIHQKESFQLPGALWFAFSTLQWQGFERAPRSLASRVLTVFWFAFVTLTLVTYTGGLINNLWWASMAQTHNPLKHPANSLPELLNMEKGKFHVGAVRGSNTHRYITEVLSKKKMEFAFLTSYWQSDIGKKNLVETFEDGVARVRKGDFAFIGESMQIRHELNKRPCDLTTIGEDFAFNSYGMAVPKNSPYKEPLNQALLELRETGELDDLERTWWEGRSECWNYTVVEQLVEKSTRLYLSQARPRSIDLNMFWAPLSALLVGIFLSLAVGLIEILYYKYKGRYHETNRPQGQTLNLEHEDGNI